MYTARQINAISEAHQTIRSSKDKEGDEQLIRPCIALS